ncbi:SusC/RagA family TonB-linked outer membrane protein [Sphingobacterium sp. LRF_L2]|uniref:SusC/RagA family TonB-linked outer membrane protein n=1 Tax=Sphingobacterium sp. LRF_L2 TaxID=3369421 RepID=UPI003F61B851
MWKSDKLTQKWGKLWVLPFALLATSGSVQAHFIVGENNVRTFVAQQNVTGTVKDARTGAPVVGATITVKGTTTATQTGENGEFSIAANTGQLLVANFIGYKAGELPVVTGPVDFLLQADESALEEVVVVGYGTQTRREITSAVASVKEKDFNKGGVRNPMELVQGKVAGLNITSTQGSNPNGGTNIQLRGMASLKGTNSPLVVIDGIPGGSLDLIKQGDIESIDVLKDGSAAAIYGTRGNGGVILVTTKKGRSGTPQFEYYTYGQREFVDKKPAMLDATQFRELVVKGMDKPDYDLGATTDLFDELVNKDNFSHFHNFVASGGGEKSTYRAAINYEKAEGIAKASDRDQFGGRFNFTQTGLGDRLTVSTNIATSISKANLLGGGINNDLSSADYGKTTGGDFEQAIQRNPTAPLYNEDGSFYQTQEYNNYNPLSRLAHRIFERDQQNFSGDTKVKLQLIDQLSVSAFGSYVRRTANDRLYRSTLDWDQRIQSDYQGMGYAAKRNVLEWTKTFESTIDYLQTFNEKHKVTGLLGYSYQYSTLERFNMANNGFTSDGFLDWDMGSGIALREDNLPRPTMGSFKEDNTLIAFFGRVNYNFDDRYFVTAILRREGSSRFGANNKWGNFPAISAGWNITNEAFFTNKDVINDLKLRVGYGVTGNQDIPNYQSLIRLGTGGVYPQNGIYYETYGIASNPNPDLRWEEKAETNIGLDFALLNNKLTGALDLYHRRTSNLIYEYRAQQPSYAQSKIWYNVGEVVNKGIELQLTYQALQRENFSWDINFAGNYQNNKLTKLSSDLFQSNWLEFGGLPSPGNLGNAIRLEEGGEIGSFYGKRFAGLDDEGKWLFYKADGTTGAASEMNNDDLAYIGNGIPKFQASLGNRFTYKNFDLTIFLRGKFKYDILNTADMFFGNKKWLPNNVFESAFGKHAALDDDPQYSDYYLENGSFVKIDNVTLGYTIKTKTPLVRNLYVYLTGRNIATMTSYTGLDPELQDTGFEGGIDSRGFYPRTQSWLLGLNIGF